MKVVDTKRNSLFEIGSNITEVGERVMSELIPPKAPRELISAKTKTDSQGRTYGIFEFAWQGKFSPESAKKLGRKRYQLHCKALLAVFRKKQFILQVTSEEKRWEDVAEQLSTSI